MFCHCVLLLHNQYEISFVSPFQCLETIIFILAIQQTFKVRITTFQAIENLSIRAIPKLMRAKASEQWSKFCEQVEQKPNFAST